jgi:hypothetical protein
VQPLRIEPARSGGSGCTPLRFVRPGFVGALALLLLLAFGLAPAQHARLMLARATDFPATVHAVHHHGTPGGGHDHLTTPACLACVLMAAPGLMARSLTAACRIAAVAAARFERAVGLDPMLPARTVRRARAPPAVHSTGSPAT